MGQGSPLTAEEWGQIGTGLKLLWAALACALYGGTALMLAHAFIPSAVATRTIPASVERIFRIPLYVTGVLAVIALVVLLVWAGTHFNDIATRINPRYWQ